MSIGTYCVGEKLINFTEGLKRPIKKPRQAGIQFAPR